MALLIVAWCMCGYIYWLYEVRNDLYFDAITVHSLFIFTILGPLTFGVNILIDYYLDKKYGIHS